MKLHEFMTTPKLAGKEFSGPSWSTWRVIARLIDGDAKRLTTKERRLALKLTGRTKLPETRVHEIYIGAGRRSGKSRFGSLVACWLAAQEYPQLAAGETAVVAHVAPDRRQAAIDLAYARGTVEESPPLRAALENATQDTLTFRHDTQLEVATASYRTVRGRTLAGAVIDESAFLRADDAALPDVELVRALRPALLTLNGLLLVISSPHRKVGLLYEAHRRYYGNDEATRGLYIQAESRELNPTLDTEAIAEAMEDDPAAAQSEYLGVFRADLEGFLDDATVDAAIVPDRRELAPVPGVQYVAFCDPSGGRSDSFTLAISHKTPKRADRPERLVLDAVRSIAPPFDPEPAVRDMAATLRAYGLSQVHGDRYAAEWVVSAFRRFGVEYVASERTRSEIYLEALPHFSRGAVELLDLPPLRTQLLLLERRTRAGGRDSVDHPRGGHDDLANSVVGALLEAGAPATSYFTAAMLADSDETVFTRPPDRVFAVLGTVGRDYVAAVTFAHSPHEPRPLVIVDHDVAPADAALMSGAWLEGVYRRLAAWAAALHSAAIGIYVEQLGCGLPLLELGAGRRLGVIDATDDLKPFPSALPERLDLAARYLGAGLVKIAPDAAEKVTTLRGIVENFLLSEFTAYDPSRKESEQRLGFLHALSTAALLAFVGDAEAERRLAQSNAPIELHGPAFSRTAAPFQTGEPASSGPTHAELAERYQRDLARWQAQCDAAREDVRARRGDPTWKESRWQQLPGIPPPPENRLGGMQLSGYEVRAMIEEAAP